VEHGLGLHFGVKFCDTAKVNFDVFTNFIISHETGKSHDILMGIHGVVLDQSNCADEVLADWGHGVFSCCEHDPIERIITRQEDFSATQLGIGSGAAGNFCAAGASAAPLTAWEAVMHPETLLLHRGF